MDNIHDSSQKARKKTDIFRSLAERGFSLIRLSGKIPVEQGWTKYCTERRVFDEIGFEPNDNAGIACGPASVILVIDVDDWKLFQQICKDKEWDVPNTMMVQTGSGKPHFYYQYPQDNNEYGT